MKRVLAAVDFSEDSRRAANRAALIAGELGLSLELLHVQDGSASATLRDLLGRHGGRRADAAAHARGQLAEWARDLRDRSGIEAKARVVRGEVLPALLERGGRADLVLLGAQGWNPVRDWIAGSTPERLLGRLRRPALVVRRVARGPYRRVVVAVDLSAASLPAIETARRLAPAAKLTLVHVFGLPFEGKLRYAGVADAAVHRYRNEARRESHERLLELVRRIPGDHGRIETALCHGHPPRALLEQARHRRADLVVTGRGHRPLAEEWLVGSVTRHLLSAAGADVLVVPPDQA